MAANAPEPTPPRPGALQSMLARLRGMAEAMLPRAHESAEEGQPAWGAPAAAPAAARPAEGDSADAEVLPSFDALPPAGPAAAEGAGAAWPGLAWERELLDTARHPGLPRVLDQLVDGDWEYLVEE